MYLKREDVYDCFLNILLKVQYVIMSNVNFTLRYILSHYDLIIFCHALKKYIISMCL